MNWKEYEKLAMRTMNEDLSIEESLSNAIMGLNGEIGEVTDIIKKHLYQGHNLNIEDVKEELGDVLWYLALLTNVLDLSLDEIKIENVEKLNKRYGGEFSVDRSVNRLGEMKNERI